MTGAVGDQHPRAFAAMRVEGAGDVGVMGGVDGVPSARPQLLVEEVVVDVEAEVVGRIGTVRRGRS